MSSNKPYPLKTFIEANLFIILPSILIVVIMIFLDVLLTPTLKSFLQTYNSACDFRAGGGSISGCEDGSLFDAWGILLVVATIISFFLSRFILKQWKVKWKSPLYGIGLFYGIPITLFIIASALTNGIYGNPRGAINNIIITLAVPTVTIGLGLLGVKNYQIYRQKLNLK